MPVEAVEVVVPLLFARKELRSDSGGAGRFRGGLGQTISFKAADRKLLLINAMFDRVTIAASGRAGGMSGALGDVRLRSGRPLAAKGLQEIPADDELTLDLPGGGGYGAPRERAADLIRADLRAGYITPDAARSLYGFKG
jgi:N-methylhydantoinase B